MNGNSAAIRKLGDAEDGAHVVPVEAVAAAAGATSPECDLITPCPDANAGRDTGGASPGCIFGNMRGPDATTAGAAAEIGAAGFAPSLFSRSRPVAFVEASRDFTATLIAAYWCV